VYSERYYLSYLHLEYKVSTQLLYRQQSYNEYQEYLYSLCRSLKDKGLGYRRISYNLNGRGLKSVRNTVFTFSHIQSILNKGLIRKKRLESLKHYDDFNLKLLDVRIELVEI